MAEHNQFELLGQRRFLPFFVTQFAGAFNDNLFKSALVILIAYGAADGLAADADLLINLAAGLFILPFFLFSATAGQLAERVEKSRLIRTVKLAEVAIMATALVAFWLAQTWGLIWLLFLMGTQSTFFGPVKYGILPQHLAEEELVGGNGLVEMATFVAILLGTITGGILIGLQNGALLVGLAVIAVAILGWLTSRWIPLAPATAPELRLNWNIVAETAHIVRLAMAKRSVFQSILGISWFWMLGAVYLTQFPGYTKGTLAGDEAVVTLLLATFSLGVGVGSVFCERLSGRRIELGLVPFGSIGLSLFGLDLFFAIDPAWTGAPLRGIGDFLADAAAWRVIVDLFLLGAFGGLYIVPLYALVQQRTEPRYRSRVIAANNILNALFMVGSAALAILCLEVAGLSVPELFLLMAALNVAVAAYIYTLVPEFLMRFLVWLLISTIYRVRPTGLDSLPDRGAALLVANHVSYVDAPIIAGSIRRPVRFVMDHQIFRVPVLNFIFRTAGAVPIAPRRVDEAMYEAAFEKICDYLAAGELVCIFPEGQITRHGEMNPFRGGVARILKDQPVPVVPMALKGLWGSLFSFAGGRVFTKLPRKLFARIELDIGETIPPEAATPERLHEAVAALRGTAR
ncbi:MAG: MFS transporter [Alphaproteobacteria bacterium]|jgi:hypothetical protein|nr:MFS transporter [Alphaproteobacteria bacterium]